MQNTQTDPNEGLAFATRVSGRVWIVRGFRDRTHLDTWAIGAADLDPDMPVRIIPRYRNGWEAKVVRYA